MSGPICTGNWVYDPTKLRYRYWSDESYRIWDFDPLLGLPSREAMWDRIHPDDRGRAHKIAGESLQWKEDIAIALRLLLPSGTIKYLKLEAHHVFSPLGALVEVVSTQVDVTERKGAGNEQEGLRQLNADFAHLNRLRIMGELTASLAHEITQPIAAARNNAQAALNFLDKEPPDLGEVREALAGILDDANRAANIIDRIRDQVKKAPARKERFDLNLAINEVIALSKSAIAKNTVSLQVDFERGLLLVTGDRVQLQQVALNLILNALDAMSSVEAGRRQLTVSTEKLRTDDVLVTVRDSGPGIERNSRERVFDAFYTSKPNGMGVGLSICRFIINAHGGRLWTDANGAQGAAFHFTIPGVNVSRVGQHIALEH
jgi:C4-dicarboxylate-specific signal transduction histidine kinase